MGVGATVWESCSNGYTFMIIQPSIVYGYILFPLYFEWKKPSHVEDVSHIRNHQQGDVPKPQRFFLQKKRTSQDVISFNATLSSCNRAQHWQMTMSLCDELQHEMQMDVTSFKAFAESCVTWDVEKQQEVLFV